ncbi:F-box/LRR-repeat protein 13-like [Rhodamnia argentea]|uniref:F-box/LRR-repeat protein 13-like n=1 Tax=Rhodamnia argentea TaxID=178133 RepID=A0A8B8Q2E0_9MYRT|nr:F-box/LRR-repeat protein 13-like [Rhodamnia argentea]
MDKLPRDVLVSILYLLPMKEAARTSVLSRAWRDLWKHVLSLDLNVSPALSIRGANPGILGVNWVKLRHALEEGHRGRLPEEFRVRVVLDESSGLGFAIGKKVQILEIDLTPCWPEPCGASYTFPRIPSLDFASMRSLKSLCLRHVNVGGVVLQLFLSQCPSLERLCVSGSDHLIDLIIPGPSPLELKHLDISRCRRLESIIIAAPTPNLVSFRYDRSSVELHVEDAPRLAELTICGFTSAVQHSLWHYLPQLEALHLKVSEAQLLSVFFNIDGALFELKHLTLDVSDQFDPDDLNPVSLYSYLVEKAPSLNRLTLQMLDAPNKEDLEIPGPMLYTHASLEVVEIIGFDPRIRFFAVMLFRYWLENTSSLKRLVVDPRVPSLLGTTTSQYPMPAELREARDYASRLAKAIPLPLGVELVIV